MIKKILFFFLILFGLQSCSSNLFYKKIISEKSDYGFESVIHHEYCFYKKKKISRCGFLGVSPSKNRALIQEPVSGHLFIYDVLKNQKILLTDNFVGLVDRVIWSNDELQLTVEGMNIDGVKWGPIMVKGDGGI